MLALSLWNKKIRYSKKDYLGLTGHEGNHGEDVKEIYYYLDATPTHAYMKMLYKYPQAEFPYHWLVAENAARTKFDPEFELHDTGVFDQHKYFDVFIEYAKGRYRRYSYKNYSAYRSSETAPLNILPTIWFRNTWAWGYDDATPNMFASDEDIIEIRHKTWINSVFIVKTVMNCCL